METIETTAVLAEEKVDHKKRLNEWFDYKFLTVYQNTTKVEQARRELHRYQPPDDLLEQIYEWVLADNRRRSIAAKRNEFYPSPPNSYTFFHESRWMDKIPSRSDVQFERALLKCQCGADSKHLYPFEGKHCCLKCYDEKAHPNFKREVYDNLCKHGLGKLKEETREAWIARMRQMGREVIAKRFGKTSNTTPP